MARPKHAQNAGRTFTEAMDRAALVLAGTDGPKPRENPIARRQAWLAWFFRDHPDQRRSANTGDQDQRGVRQPIARLAGTITRVGLVTRTPTLLENLRHLAADHVPRTIVVMMPERGDSSHVIVRETSPLRHSRASSNVIPGLDPGISASVEEIRGRTSGGLRMPSREPRRRPTTPYRHAASASAPLIVRPLLSADMCTVSPSFTAPSRIIPASGFCNERWITRFNGRAP